MATASGVLTHDSEFARYTLFWRGDGAGQDQDVITFDSNMDGLFTPTEVRGVAWRYTLNVPRLANISSAVLTLRTDETGATPGYVQVRTAVADNPAFPTTWAEFSALPLIGAQVSFVTPPGTAGTTFTVDATNAVKHAVHRTTWNSGEALILVIEPTQVGFYAIVRGKNTATGTHVVSLDVNYTEYDGPASGVNLALLGVG